MLDAAKLLSRMSTIIESIPEHNEKFAKGFAANPLWALENSDRVFLDAARLDIYTRYINALKAERCTVADILESAMSDVMLGADSSPSTSEVTNLVNRMKRKVFVEVVRMINGGL